MKIILEDTDSEELQITVRGNLADARVQQIVTLLKSSKSSTKIMLYDEGREILVDVAQVYYFETAQRKNYAVTAEGRYSTRQTLAEVLELFKGQGISQIGKAVLVNVNHVKSLEAEFSGNYTVNLTDGSRLVASRFYMREFRCALLEV